MALSRLQKYGDGILAIFDDGSRVLCMPGPNSLYYPMGASSGGPVDPPPGGTSTFKWPMNPDALNQRNGDLNGAYGSSFGGSNTIRPDHNGVDMSWPPTFTNGMPIRAIADGTVVRAYWEPGGGGWYVELDHGRYRSGYGHGGTDAASSFQVSDGQPVTQGQHLMNAGETGTATGPHLHFQISDMNLTGAFWTSHIDPHAFMAAQNPNDYYV